jgi:hypothetical protein
MSIDDDINAQVRDLEIFIEHAEEICRIAKREANIKINTIRNKCPHSHVKYVPDASGNNDSFEYCVTCGLEKKRF